MAGGVTRCNGCGKPIENNEGVKRVVSGIVKGKSVKEEKEWGVFHASCFNRSFDHPDAVFEEMKRAARASR